MLPLILRSFPSRDSNSRLSRKREAFQLPEHNYVNSDPEVSRLIKHSGASIDPRHIFTLSVQTAVSSSPPPPLGPPLPSLPLGAPSPQCPAPARPALGLTGPPAAGSERKAPQPRPLALAGGGKAAAPPPRSPPPLPPSRSPAQHPVTCSPPPPCSALTSGPLPHRRPHGSGGATHPDVKSCWTLNSLSRSVSSIVPASYRGGSRSGAGWRRDEAELPSAPSHSPRRLSAGPPLAEARPSAC